MVQGVDETKLLILMLAGAVFAGAGLFLLFRNTENEDAANIEFLGLKFRASSAGLTVFLIGAVFLAAPVFVPVKQVAQQEPSPAPTPPSLNPPSGTSLPALPSGREVEPNNKVQESNQIELGKTYSGKAKGGEPDWFVITLPEKVHATQIEFGLRHVSGTSGNGYIYDERQQPVGRVNVSHNGADYLLVDIDGNRKFFIKVRVAHEMEYELFVNTK